MKPSKLIFMLSLAQLTACSYFFPDKETDYVYSKEIKPLEMPPDLHAEKQQIAADDSVGVVSGTLANTVEYFTDDLGAYLRINSPFARVWRIVGKAITTQSIEIIDKDRSHATYYVKYDPALQEVADGSFWDELVFFFGSDVHQEKLYLIYLAETEQGASTGVFVQDEKGNSLASGDGEKLLNLLYEAIKKDFEG